LNHEEHTVSDRNDLDVTESWPELRYARWKDTCATLHRWLQVVGKVRLALTPWLNHSWHATFYLTARGLTTSPIHYGQRSFEMTFDFIDHVLRIDAGSDSRRIELRSRSVARFHDAVFLALAELGIAVSIHELPNEVPDPIRLDRDQVHAVYDSESAFRFFRVLTQVDRVFKQFRTGFLGKCSPVHLFWGSLDLAVTRFSGRRAPLHPGGVPSLPDTVAREAYSHEVSSAGFWPGGAGLDDAAFYSYAYPAPAGFREAKVQPAGAYFDANLGEFILPYAVLRAERDPDRALLDFLTTTYEAAANGAAWDRDALECSLGRPGVPRSL
jgi:hypothetical protein